MITDQNILEHIRKDGKKGLHLLFLRYYKPLVLFVNTYLNDIHTAKDIVQEQFIKFWKDKLYNNQFPISLSFYLLTLTKNASLHQLKKIDVLTQTADLSHFEIAEERIQQVMDSLLELLQKSHLVVKCIMIQKMKYKEAVKELNVSVNTIKKLLQNGLAKLKLSLSICFSCRNYCFTQTNETHRALNNNLLPFLSIHFKKDSILFTLI